MVTEHISDEGLLALVDGTLSNDDRKRFLAHARSCESCHELLVAAAPAIGTLPGNADAEPAESLVRGARVGRYTLLERIGRGATADVHAAFDPELDRKIALKLLHTGARGLLVREAQALAKLSHPNVVSVFEIGEHAGHAFVAMEFIAGETLAVWMKRRHSWPTIVNMFLGAGHGLAAAHGAGIVHRDFKPENVLVGSDGRPRVADFGLARTPPRSELLAVVDDNTATTLTEPGLAVGTPAYMAPEQLRGEPATAASDQFAFSVALWEALFGARPFAAHRGRARLDAIERGDVGPMPADARVPSRLRRVLARGLAFAPSARWPSDAELLAALERTLPGRRRALVAGAVAVLAAIGGTVAVTSTRTTPAPRPCANAGAPIDGDWNQLVRVALKARLAALGDYARDDAPRILGVLEQQATRWKASSVDACSAHARGELTTQLYERTLGCLERTRSAFGEAVSLVGRSTPERLPDTLVALHVLGDPSLCRAATVSARITPPPRGSEVRTIDNEIERVRILAHAADPEAPARAAAVVVRAENTAYPPLIARARLVEGIAWFVRRDEKAISILDRAGKEALQSNEDAAFVEAFARAMFMRAVKGGDPTVARSGIALAEPIAKRLSADESFARGLLFNNAGVMEMAAKDRTAARTWFERAASEPLSRGDVELVVAYGNLALVTDDASTRSRLLETQRSVLETRLGRNHPRTLDIAQTTAMMESDAATATAQLQDACMRMARFHAVASASQLDNCGVELGWFAEMRGDRSAARAAYAALRPTHELAQLGRAYTALVDGRYDDAIRDGLAAAEQLGRAWWTQDYAADALVVAAHGERQRGNVAAARMALQRARAMLAALPSSPSQQRRLLHVEELLGIGADGVRARE